MEDHEPAVQALCRYHKETDPKTLILRLCRELLTEAPTDAGATPLEVLGSCRCIRKIVYKSLAGATDCSAMLAQNDGGYIVTLDEGEPHGRQRRSLAHEITHTFFREVTPGPPGPEEERLCELGAAELTMPAQRMRKFVKRRGSISFEVVNLCAQEFDVTNDAAARRLVELSKASVCYLVAVRMRTQKQEQFGLGHPRLRVASWTWSPTWPDQHHYRGLAIDADSLIGRAFDSQEFRRGREHVGISHRDGVYEIEAVGYSFRYRGRARAQVAVIVRATTRSERRTRPGPER